ncbi:MAG: RelA/SpoT family protein [Candidatus Paceibacterota bacterium]
MSDNLQEIYDLAPYLNEIDRELVARALAFAEKIHAGQNRFSGEPYIIHPIATAKILAELKVDAKTIAAGLLHDVLEDSQITPEELEKEFGADIPFLIQGVTKLGTIKYQGLERHVESLRKFFIAMAEDIRVVIIRLADRLHNVQTLEYIRADKQERIALETIEIYAPIANRLGIGKLKSRLEDASFPYAYPAGYAETIKLRKTKNRETLKRLEKIQRSLRTELSKHEFDNLRIDYRLKSLYSLYVKLKVNDMDIDRIYDISAIRVIVDSVSDCYRALGLIHAKWRPVPDRLRDYIANPKPNGYQSIHTAVFTGDGMVEIQIRTAIMHTEAEYGVASHVAYVESGKKISGGYLSKKTAWIGKLLEAQKNITDSNEYLATIKNDFFTDCIFVFTPKGDVIELPPASTVLDFAYEIHSDIGHHAVAGYVNNKYSSLDTRLKNDDIVRIETKEKSHPTARWFNYVTTNNARRLIRIYLQQQENKNTLPTIKPKNSLKSKALRQNRHHQKS